MLGETDANGKARTLALATAIEPPPDFLPYIALIAFGGVRREELHKGLMWEAINFDRGYIIVSASIA